MALALPLLIPFAEAAGIAIGALTTAAGLDILSDKVEEYIEDNPENAQKIFAMIMPEQGLANILKNESDDGEEMSEEEVAESESGSTKDMVLEELNKKTGNYSDPNATGNYASKRGRIIGRLKREGKIRQDNDPNYDPDKKYKGYTKFYKKKYADGGIMGGNKTYHQVRDQFMPMDSESMGYANGGGVGSMMQPKKVPMQGGVQNHLGKQKMVTVPQRWQSAEDHPQTELAYITKPEKNLLLKKDIHNSLNGSVNRGPEGVMSLNGWGSTDSNQNVSGATASAAETGGNTERDRADFRAAGMSPQLQQDFRNAAINAGAGQRVNPGFFDSSTFLSPGEIAGAKAYRQDPSNQYANQSYRNTGQTGIMNFVKRGGLFGNLIRGLGQKFGLGKKYNDTSTSISGDFNNNLGLGGINNATYDFDPNAKINQHVDTTGSSRFSNKSLGDINTMPNANVTGLTSDITSNQINEFGDGRIGNINDEFGQSPEFNVSQINEFGESPEFNASQINEFGQSPEFNAGLVNEFGTSPQFNTSLINEFGDNRNINMDEFADNNMQMQNYLTDQANFQQPITASQINEFGDNRNINMNEFAGNDIQMQNYLTDQANYNADPLGNPNMDPRIVPEEYGLVGNNGIASLTNSSLPGNDTFAGNYSQNAVSNQLYDKDYDLLDPFDQQKLDSLIEQVGTKSTGELARNGGIMGYNGY